MQVRLASIALMLTLTACGQAPDNEGSRTALQVDKSGSGKGNDQARSDPVTSRQSSFSATYELQGAPGDAGPFPTKEKCDTVRAAKAKTQADDDKKLISQGLGLPNRPLLICVLL